MTRLFHVSENSEIPRFEPRPVPSTDAGVTGLAVWAVDEIHLPNYLLPRDCPRVTFANGLQRVVVVENSWKKRIEQCTLWLYEFPNVNFQLVDAGAGYYISRETIIPKSKTKIKNLFDELRLRKAEVRFLPHLWDIRDEITQSGVEFSIIRFRYARPRN